METIQNILSIIWSSHFVFKGLADMIVVFLIGRMLVYGYREHSYLYQFEDRSRTLDNWINFLVPFVNHVNVTKYRKFLALNMSRAGSRRDWTTSHFLGSQLIYAGVTALAAYLFLHIILGITFMIVLILSMLAFALPAIKLHDLSSSRYKSCNKDLPFFIDYLALAMGAGLNFNQALVKVVEDAPESPLAEEFKLIQSNIHLGQSRTEALLEMERRMQSPVLKLFVQTLVQATELGTDVGRTLGVISETLSQKRFQLAEEAAGKISVRMMIPMMIFVMPSVLIVLLGPMILSYIQTI
jgi:tight adherence protein C